MASICAFFMECVGGGSGKREVHLLNIAVIAKLFIIMIFQTIDWINSCSCCFQIYYFFGHLFLSFLAAFGLHVLFEAPVANLENIFLRRDKGQKGHTTDGTDVCKNTYETGDNLFQTSNSSALKRHTFQLFANIENIVMYLPNKVFKLCKLK